MSFPVLEVYPSWIALGKRDYWELKICPGVNPTCRLEKIIAFTV
jgi:hypothetical protein